ncbi:MAG: uracil-DNA glycosylase [Crocinitomicaceae bacterium]|jgi:uracil-DNA glycosylase|nr:uracil-DNA glycosylase [Crocinitomicaceae bacterium]
MDMFDLSMEMPSDWWAVVKKYFSDQDLLSLNEQLNERMKSEIIVPKREYITRAFHLTPWKDLKVVILGQDPYPTRGHAHGLAFSTEPMVQPFPRSLRNIFIELDRSIEDFTIPITGNLEHWAQQGVLLLNTQLTTKEGEANAHANIGWQNFTRALLTAIEKEKEGIVGLFWGKPAEKLAELWSSRQHKLITSHPSPLSVRKGFAGCDHFVLANRLLTAENRSPILWG